MEGFPVRVIGNILSHFADVQDVVRASWTCRKWRAAFRHLHTLRHEYVEVFHFWETGDEEQELEQKHECLLTDTILQTSGLQNLSIIHSVSFSATAVVAWLLHTGDSSSSDLPFAKVHTLCELVGEMFPNEVSQKLGFLADGYEVYQTRSHCSTIKLRRLTIDDVELEHFDLGGSTCDCANLKELELRAEGLVVCIAIDRVLSLPSIQLRRLQLMDIPLAVELKNMKLERIAWFFPRLSYLGLSYTLLPGPDGLSYPTPMVEKQFRGSVLGKVRTLELEGPKLDGSFPVLMGEALKRCPNVTRLIVRIDEGEAEIKGACDVTRFIQLVRQYERVVIEFRNRHDRITGR